MCVHADTCVLVCMFVCVVRERGRNNTLNGPAWYWYSVISGREGFSHLVAQFSQLAQLGYAMEILFLCQGLVRFGKVW